MSSSVRVAFRQLMRAQQQAFRNDRDMQRAATSTIRERFRAYAQVKDEEQMKQLLVEAEEAKEFLQTNVVQAPLNEHGRYQVDATKIDETKVSGPDLSEGACCS